MSRCFHAILPDNNVAFIPEGLFDNLINMVTWNGSDLTRVCLVLVQRRVRDSFLKNQQMNLESL